MVQGLAAVVCVKCLKIDSDNGQSEDLVVTRKTLVANPQNGTDGHGCQARCRRMSLMTELPGTEFQLVNLQSDQI